MEPLTISFDQKLENMVCHIKTNVLIVSVVSKIIKPTFKTFNPVSLVIETTCLKVAKCTFNATK